LQREREKRREEKEDVRTAIRAGEVNEGVH